MKAKSRRRVYNYKISGRVEYDEFYMKLSKPSLPPETSSLRPIYDKRIAEGKLLSLLVNE